MELSKRSRNQIRLGIFALVFLSIAFLLIQILPQLLDFAGYESFRIPSKSMEPTILQNDFVLTKRIKDTRAIKGGDLVVFSFAAWKALDFKKEEDPDCIIGLNQRYLVKRIIGTPGDIVEMGSDGVLVNGVTISLPSEQIEKLNSGISYPIIANGPYKKLMFHISEGHVFVMGDNRPNSADSRCWGEVPLSTVRAKVSRVFYSLDGEGTRWSRIGKKVN